MIYAISSFRWQTGERKRHFRSTLCGGKVSQKLLGVERPKSHTRYSFWAEESFAYFLLGRKYSDSSEEGNAVSCASSWLLRGKDQKERRFLEEKKASRGFDPEQPEAWVHTDRVRRHSTGGWGAEARLQLYTHVRGWDGGLEWLYVIKTLRWTLMVCSLPNYWTLSLNVFI